MDEHSFLCEVRTENLRMKVTNTHRNIQTVNTLPGHTAACAVEV
jgi:hypothetical protein